MQVFRQKKIKKNRLPSHSFSTRCKHPDILPLPSYILPLTSYLLLLTSARLRHSFGEVNLASSQAQPHSVAVAISHSIISLTPDDSDLHGWPEKKNQKNPFIDSRAIALCAPLVLPVGSKLPRSSPSPQGIACLTKSMQEKPKKHIAY